MICECYCHKNRYWQLCGGGCCSENVERMAQQEEARNLRLLGAVQQEIEREYAPRFEHLQKQIDALRKERKDHLDGIKYALNMVDEIEQYFKACGYEYTKHERNPFQEMRNKMRMILGLPLITR